MPDDRPGFYATHTITTEPLRLPEGAVVVVTRDEPWKTDRTERNYLVSELAKRDDLIAHYKIETRGLREETKGLEAKVRNLQANLADLAREKADRNETIAKLNEQDQRRCSKILEQTRAIASLRTQFARAGAIEAAAKVALDWLRSHGSGNYEVIRGLSDALAASPSLGEAKPERRKPENNVGCPNRIPPSTSSSDPCPDCGSSRWTPNGDCPKCLERDSAPSPGPRGTPTVAELGAMAGEEDSEPFESEATP